MKHKVMISTQFWIPLRTEYEVKVQLDSASRKKKLATIVNDLYAKTMEDKELIILLKKHNKLENCPYAFAPKCSPNIWNKRVMTLDYKKIQMHPVKTAYVIVEACGWVMDSKLQSALCKYIVTLLIGSLAFLGSVSSELNQFRRDYLKNKLPEMNKSLAKNVPAKLEWYFGDDLNKSINTISSTNTVDPRFSEP